MIINFPKLNRKSPSTNIYLGCCNPLSLSTGSFNGIAFGCGVEGEEVATVVVDDDEEEDADGYTTHKRDPLKSHTEAYNNSTDDDDDNV